MKWLQELLLGEQTPSPTLSRSSSVSSVLMVSICTRPGKHLKWKYKCLVGPKHPPLCQPRCPRGEDDASSTDKNPSTGETRLKATKYYFNNVDWDPKHILFLSKISPHQQVSKEEGEETTAPTSLQRDNNEIISLQRDSPEFVSLEEDTLSAGGGGGVGQERKEGRLEKENFRLKEQVSW